MKSSIFIVGVSAALALAKPLDTRDIKTEVDIVYEWATVTVTGDVAATPAPEPTPVAPVAPVVQNENAVKNENAVQGNYHAAAVVADSKPKGYPVHQLPAPTPDVVIVTVTAEQPEPTPQAPPPPPAPTPDYDIVTVTQGLPQPDPVPAAPAEPVPASPAPVPSDFAAESRPVSANTMEGASVNSHNQHRSNHSAPEASWNQRIAGYASNTASTCHYAHDMKQGDADYGQNIAMWGISSGAEKLGDVGAINMAIHDMWYNGELNLFLPSYYGEANPPNDNFEKWGHFSQMVWKESTGVGCAAQFCPAGTMNDMDSWFMVCNYYPAGNMGGAYGKNVLRPLGKSKVVASSPIKTSY